ncbi:putative Subtilisin DY [Glarea lozoyensis 74030]|uniref:Putative Subtilisin DY n=1 Tax=Glarea lozoyensis (strain ATCC 74030 / MF5533) TaxID=1104152 RepID=H0EGT7_GLAL7|nr:putative Subtilisin DY [Glarea lozoyensis 74030]
MSQHGLKAGGKTPKNAVHGSRKKSNLIEMRKKTTEGFAEILKLDVQHDLTNQMQPYLKFLNQKGDSDQNILHYIIGDVPKFQADDEMSEESFEDCGQSGQLNESLEDALEGFEESDYDQSMPHRRLFEWVVMKCVERLTEPNDSSLTPMQYAISSGRLQVVDWFQKLLLPDKTLKGLEPVSLFTEQIQLANHPSDHSSAPSGKNEVCAHKMLATAPGELDKIKSRNETIAKTLNLVRMIELLLEKHPQGIYSLIKNVTPYQVLIMGCMVGTPSPERRSVEEMFKECCIGNIGQKGKTRKTRRQRLDYLYPDKRKEYLRLPPVPSAQKHSSSASVTQSNIFDRQGYSDVYASVFEWLKGKGIWKIFRVRVDDICPRPHGDSFIEAALSGFQLDEFDWRKLDIGSDTIINGAPDGNDREEALNQYVESFIQRLTNRKPGLQIFPRRVSLDTEGNNKDHGKGLGGSSGRPQVCPNVRLFAIRVNDAGRNTTGARFTAITWAVETCKADIISMSWSFQSDAQAKINPDDVQLFREAIGKAIAQKKILFASLHDQGSTLDYKTFLPMGIQGVIRIGSSTSYGKPSDMNSDGSIEFALPGEKVENHASGKEVTGSSVATAIAAGLGALIIYCADVAKALVHE